MSLVLERRASKEEILELYLERRLPGPARVVCHPRRRRGGAALLRQGRRQHQRGRGGADRGRHPEPGPALAVRQPRVAPSSAATSCCAQWRPRSSSRPTRPTAPSREPLQVVARAVDNEAPYFVDMVSEQVAQAFPGVTAQTGRVDVFTTLDLNLQRAALDAVRDGPGEGGQAARPPPACGAGAGGARRRRPAHRRDPRDGGRPLLQPVAVQPRAAARRQPGSVFKPFVYLAAFEHAAEEGRTDLTPASLTLDEPATFSFDDQVWEPRNYDDYDGEITWRRALAMSRNLGTIQRGRAVGFDTIAALWRGVGVGTPPRRFPSITLGVFELTPLEVAQAYTLFTNGGRVRPLTSIQRIEGRAASFARRRRPSSVRRGERHGVPGDQHDAQRAERRHRPPARAGWASRSTPPARPARPTTCATPGSSASRRSC